MDDINGAIIGFIKRRGNAIVHSLTLIGVTSLLGVNLTGSSYGIATKQYVTDQVDAVAQQAEDNAGKLDRILELNIIAEIEKILRFKCMRPGDPSRDQTLRELEIDYRELTGQQYQRPSCDYLTD